MNLLALLALTCGCCNNSGNGGCRTGANGDCGCGGTGVNRGGGGGNTGTNCGCGGTGTGGSTNNNCGDGICAGNNAAGTVFGSPSAGCSGDSGFNNGRGMDPRLDPRMDVRPFMPFQGGTCGCEDNFTRQNQGSANCGSNCG